MTEKDQRSHRLQGEVRHPQSDTAGRAAAAVACAEQGGEGLAIGGEVFSDMCIGERGDPVLG